MKSKIHKVTKNLILYTSLLEKENIPSDERVYIHPEKGEKAPQGRPILQGERGGDYYIPEEVSPEIVNFFESCVKEADYIDEVFFYKNVKNLYLRFFSTKDNKKANQYGEELSKKLKEINEDLKGYLDYRLAFNLKIKEFCKTNIPVPIYLGDIPAIPSVGIAMSNYKLFKQFPKMYSNFLSYVDVTGLNKRTGNDSSLAIADILLDENLVKYSFITYNSDIIYEQKNILEKFIDQELSDSMETSNGLLKFSIDISDQTTSYDYLLRHEFGHIIQDNIGYIDLSNRGTLTSDSDERISRHGDLNEFLLKEYESMNTDTISSKYSVYASENFNEFGGEVIAAALCGSPKYDKDPIVIKVKEYLRQIEESL